jgi:SAM-dependent methyltransferase
MWAYPSFGQFSPGEQTVDAFIEQVKPSKDDVIIDFGCGTGRASLKLHNYGYNVFLLDFTDNSRDSSCFTLPFIEWDISKPIPSKARYGFCSDVMEHMPPSLVDDVITNIMNSAEEVFFRISTEPDAYGALISSELHLSIHPSAWWRATISKLATVVWQQDVDEGVLFHVKRNEAE